ncbi:MAG: RNA polymerase sigma factor [Candidatus Hydrogenedentota bacterium]|nr:MAG: RNA polymerase sigma factor [Candidatus Hydrogenedentota bacterium]
MGLFSKLSVEEFDELFLECTDMLYSIGYRLFGNHEDDILDFCQDVYLKARDKRHLFAGKSQFSTWLYRLAMNLGLNKIRAEKRLKVESTDKEEYFLESVESVSQRESKDGLEILLQNEITDAVQEELEKLRYEYKISLYLLYYEKMSIAEMSKQLKVKEGTIKSWIYRGKKEMRNRLEARGVL